jgi:peptide chain release factor 2
MSSPGFWDDVERSSKTVKQLKVIKSVIESWETLSRKIQDLGELVSLAQADDAVFAADIEKNLAAVTLDMEALELRTYLAGPFDPHSAFLSINAGAGGTESCDWVQMLARMYQRWAEEHDYRVKTTDILYGEDAGVKNITIFIEGEYAYGYLRAERGVHRLVRISPFDSNKRRHTSFASVDIVPEVEEDLDVAIEDKDLRIDVYRSKGAGGQSVNTTDSAVRITHVPTGLVAQCQNERSQHQNKQTAMKILKASLFELQQQKKDEELQKQYGGEKKKIEWGSQIRSYVLHPYNLVKDHRTGQETGDTGKVLDGGIDPFIQAFLKKQTKAVASG